MVVTAVHIDTVFPIGAAADGLGATAVVVAGAAVSAVGSEQALVVPATMMSSAAVRNSRMVKSLLDVRSPR
nr:hypothetical protein Ade03nite_61730 [Actinoplanes derwentensis]